MKLRGCGTALITPFRANGAIDEPALSSFVEWQVSSGVHFLVPCGTTGETPTLSQEEWLRVIDITIEVANRRVPIVAGATSNSTSEAVQRAKTVASRPGVDAILTASPYYNKPTQEGQYQHFKAIAEAIDKPVVLYNVPGRTAANIEPSTLARLAKIENIVAVKEASGSMTQIADALNVVPDDFTVLSGDDAITLPVISLGGHGIISVASNVIPAEIAQMTQAALDDKWVAARKLHRKYFALMQALFIESNPMPAKCILSMMGRIDENYRLPMVRVKPETRTKLEALAAQLGLLAERVAVS